MMNPLKCSSDSTSVSDVEHHVISRAIPLFKVMVKELV